MQSLILLSQLISGCRQIQGSSSNNVQLFTDSSTTNGANRDHKIGINQCGKGNNGKEQKNAWAGPQSVCNSRAMLTSILSVNHANLH